MWKKIGVGCISLIATCSVVFTLQYTMHAETSTTNFSGTTSLASGQYNNDANLTAITQKIIIGLYNGIPITWDVVKANVSGDLNGATGTPVLLQSNNILDFIDIGSGVGYNNNILSIYENMNTTLSVIEKDALMENVSESRQGYIFMPSQNEYAKIGTNKWGLTINESITHPFQNYTNGYCTNKGECPMQFNLWTSSLASTAFFNGYGDTITPPPYASYHISLRPWTMLNGEEFIYAVDANITSNSADLVGNDVNAPMKARFHDLTMRLDVVSTLKKNTSKGGLLSIPYQNASTAIDFFVAAIITDSTGKVVNYQSLNKTEKLGVASIDTSALEINKTYFVQLVNEKKTNDTRPTYSSKLSSKIEFEVLPAQILAYDNSSTIYTYNDNAKAGNSIGTLSRSGGVAPIKYQITGDEDNTFKNFEVQDLDEHGKSSATLLKVGVKSSGAPDVESLTNSLKAGTYKFCIESTDANNIPEIQIEGVSKICSAITVEKATRTLSFAEPSQLILKIGDSITSNLVVANSVEDILPSGITYSLTDGVANVLKGSSNATNPLQYDFEVEGAYSGTSLPTTFMFKAKFNETANYKEAGEITRDIFVYKELSALNWTADYLIYSPSDCTPGKVIGTLLAENGVGPFTYELDTPSAANNNSSFGVSSTASEAGTSVEVKTNSALTAGEYKIDFKVTDAKNKSVTNSAVIKVQANTQTAFVWKDSVGGNEISQTEFEFGSMNKKIVAEGGQSSIAVKYELAPQEMQPNGVTDASEYVTINPSNGLLTFKKVGTVKVMATRPGNATYADKMIYMDLKITQGSQSVAFKTDTVDKIQVGKDATIDATGTVTIGSGAGVGGILYDSSDKTIATIDPINGKVTGVRAGQVTLTAVLNKENTDEYTNVNYNSDYQTQSITKTITIYTPMTFAYADVIPKVKANANSIGDVVGRITVSNKSGPNPLTATISTSNVPENVDKDYFLDTPVVNGNIVTLKLKKTIDAVTHASHQGGTFKVQVIITDGNGPQTYNVTVLLDEAENKVSFTNTDGVEISVLTRIFDDTTNKFILTSKSDSNSPSQSVRYSAVDPDQDILDIKANGDVTVLKAGSTKVKVSVGASNGYGEADNEMMLTVNPATQTIKFNDLADPVKVELGGTPKLQTATGNVVLSDASIKAGVGGITYKSSNESIASIDENGMVSAVSTGPQITITATINATDSPSYNPNYKTVQCTKKIQVFTGKNVSFDKASPNLKANTVIADKKVGSITTQNTSGSIEYKIVDGDDSSMFTLVNNGQSADVKFKDDAVITANELFLHGNEYKFTVNVKDDDGETPCEVSINIDDADDEIDFKKNGTTITKISEKYGTNANEFQIIAVPKSGNAPTYKVIGNENIIDISNEEIGNATIKNAGTTKVEVTVAAGKGYAKIKKSIDVEISKGDQWIKFENDEQTHAFVKNDTFSAQAILTEVSETEASSRLLTYATTTSSTCTIDAAGTIVMLTTGDCEISAENKNENWVEKSANKTINLYDGLGAIFTQDKTPQAETASAQANSLIGKLKANGGIAPITYGVSTSTDADNKDAKFFKVNPTTGVVSLNQTITAADLDGKYIESKKAYVMYVTFTATDKEKNLAVAGKKEVLITGAPLTGVEIDTAGKGKISKVYVEQDGEFLVDLSNYKGTGAVMYQVKQGKDQNVISIENGIISILNANEEGKEAVIIEASIPPSNGYDAKTLECEVEITKATQPFKFKKEKLDLPLESSVDLEVEGVKAKDDEGNLLEWSMISRETGKLSVSNHTATSKNVEGEVKVVASVGENRNYEAATNEMTINITSKPAYLFEITVPEVTYGDIYDESNPLTPRIFVDKGVGIKTRVWTSSEPSVATIDVNGQITIIKAGETTISCTQSILGQPDVTSSTVLTINKKRIVATIENATKYVGEVIPTFHAIIASDEVVANDIIGQPIFTCKAGSIPISADTKVGTYDITGSYPSGENPNYTITVTSAKLTVKQDSSLKSWYHLEGATSGEEIDGTKWVNEDVKIVLDNASESAGIYDEISLEKELWGTSHMVSSEGLMTKDIYFRINSSKALATAQTTSLKIDKTKPIIKSITGTPAKRNAVSELLNTITFGQYFKPKLEVSILAEDILPANVTENSGLKSIHYDAYQIKEDKTLSEAIASGDMKPTDTLKLVDEGKYLVCATAQDNAGNSSLESCSGILIREIGDDSDEDGIPDLNIDTNIDGIPDINITQKEGDKKPWTNIDTNGDGIADMNIDVNGDGTPDLNTGIVMNYKANKEVDVDKDGVVDYKTDDTLFGINNIDSDKDKIPDMNIDLELDGVPELNIDTDQDFHKPEIDIDGVGDGIKDINIDSNDDGAADKNIVQISAWQPDIDVEVDGKIRYNTMQIEYKIKDSLEDNGVIVKPSDPEHTFLPNYALKVNDITKDVDEETKSAIIQITGSDSEVKRVFDVSMSDGEKTIQPDGSIFVRIPVDETIKNPRILLRNEAGKFEEIEMNIEDGYYVFETKFLGQVSIVGDIEEAVKDPTKEPDEETVIPSVPNFPETTVKGSYTGGSGGAMTGDKTNIVSLSLMTLLSMLLLKCIYKHKQDSL